jgi:hypothetical protein
MEIFKFSSNSHGRIKAKINPLEIPLSMMTNNYYPLSFSNEPGFFLVYIRAKTYGAFEGIFNFNLDLARVWISAFARVVENEQQTGNLFIFHTERSEFESQ